MKKATVFIALAVMLMLAIVGCQPKSNVVAETDMMNDSAESMDVSSGYVDLSPAEAKELMDTREDLVVLDVSPKYADGHLPNAINIYIGELEQRIGELDKDKPYLVYCHVDSASQQGAQTLIDNGFKEVYRLEGNYSAWVEAGYDIVK